MKKKRWYLLAAALLALTLAGCAPKQEAVLGNAEGTDTRIDIVATIFPPYDFARAVCGDQADLIMLVPPGSEIHSFDPSSDDIIRIQKADVFIYIGGENDEWVNTILNSMDTDNKKIIRLMDYLSPLEEETVEGMEEGEESAPEHKGEAGGEDEIEYDEHIWTSPRNAILLTKAIADALCEIDAKNKDTYRANAAAYTAQLQEVDDQIRQIVDNSSRKLLIFGDRFPFRYFVEEFGLDYRAAFNGCSTETEASAGTLAYLINTVKENHIPYIYYIELSNQNIARAISEQTGAGMLLLHSCHNVSKDDFEAGVTYLSLMRQNAENLQKGLN